VDVGPGSWIAIAASASDISSRKFSQESPPPYVAGRSVGGEDAALATGKMGARGRRTGLMGVAGHPASGTIVLYVPPNMGEGETLGMRRSVIGRNNGVGSLD